MVSPGVVEPGPALHSSICPLNSSAFPEVNALGSVESCVIDARLYVLVGVADAVRPPAAPTAVVVAAPKDVVLGVGVPNTENVNPSKFTFPVPAILYREPTA